jgi:hypothetical protein
MITTYDFASKTFGHADMIISENNGLFCGVDIDNCFNELKKARDKLTIELDKQNKKEPFDFAFIHRGYTPRIFSDGKKYRQIDNNNWQEIKD